MKSVSFWIRFLIQLLKRYWLAISASIAVGVTTFLLLSRLIPFISAVIPKTRRIGLVGRYTLSTLPPRVSHLISYGLTEILPNDRATSSPIVSHWTINDEGKEYLFYLKPDVLWQDGQPIQPEEINYQISGAEISPIDNGAKISLDSSFAPLLSYLSRPLFKKNNIGLGPYKIKKARVTSGSFSSILLTAVDNPREKILFRFYPNESDLITAFSLGEIDEAWEISQADYFSSWKNVTIKTEEAVKTRYVALFFNLRKEKLANKRVRQGLAYAIEKPAKKDRAISPISPSSWAYNENIKTYNFDPQHARKLIKDELEEGISIRLYTLPELLDWAERITQDWQKHLDINSEVHVSSFVPQTDEFDAFLGYGVIPSDPDQYFFWHSTQQGNLTGINSPRIDQALENGRKTIDYEERKKIYYDFQQALSEESPAVFLFYPESYTITRN